MLAIHCTNCRRPYPDEGVPYRCPTCGGLFDYAEFPPYAPPVPETPDLDSPGIWRYRHSFSLPAGAPVISLGEGNTPLVWSTVFDRPVAFKVEGLNPTASYKDRGSATLLSFLCSRGVQSAVEDSSGNAGASFAAYAARAGIGARVFIPDSASGPKRAQIEAYGAELVRIMGPRSNAAEAVQRAAEAGAVYASHGYLPFTLPGYATIAYELYEQMGQAPGTVIVPAGMGNLLLAIGRGFRALQAAGRIERLPRLVGVQARACAPLWAVFNYGAAGLGWVTEGPTLAEGVRIKHPLRGDAVLQMVADSGGTFVAVDEEEILPGRDELARRGLYVEPTSAITWSALAAVAGHLPDPIAVILTGSGFKALDPTVAGRG
jgi:threonine synthase